MKVRDRLLELEEQNCLHTKLSYIFFAESRNAGYLLVELEESSNTIKPLKANLQIDGFFPISDNETDVSAQLQELRNKNGKDLGQLIKELINSNPRQQNILVEVDYTYRGLRETFRTQLHLVKPN